MVYKSPCSLQKSRSKTNKRPKIHTDDSLLSLIWHCIRILFCFFYFNFITYCDFSILDWKILLYRQKIARLLATRNPNGFNFKYESLHCFEIHVDSLTSNQGTCLVLAFATCMHPVHESAIIRVWKSIDGFAIKLVICIR